MNHQTKWPIISVSIFAGITAAIQLNKVIPAIPFLRETLKISMVEAGWVMSVFSFNTIFLGFFSGVMGDKFGNRRVVIFGLISVLVGSIYGFFACNISLLALLVSRVAEGLGFALIVVSAPALIAAASSENRRGMALGLWSAYMPAGIVTVFLLSPLILKTGYWNNLWLFPILVNVLIISIFIQTTRFIARGAANPGADHYSARENIKTTLSGTGPWLLALSMGFFTMQNNSMWAWAPSYFSENQSFSMTGALMASSLLPLINVFGSIFGSVLLFRGVSGWKMIMIASITMFITTLGMIGPGLPDNLRLVCLVFYSTIGSFIPAALFALAPVFAPSQKQLASTNGMIISGANAGIFFGPPAVAAVVSYFGNWFSSTLVFCSCAAICIALSIWVRRLEKNLKIFGGNHEKLS